MENCWINLLAVYSILKEAFDKGWIDEFAKDMLEIELDGLDFITMSEDESNCIKGIIKDLSEMVENIEKQMKEDKEEQLKKLNAELDYAKYCSSLVGGK